MRHLTLPQLSATVDQALSGVSLELVRRHLEECEECRARGSKLARVDGVVAQLVSHDPGDAWLEALAIEIDERVRAEVAGRFDPPAHPAGPPPLEFAGATPALSPDELEKIWEEGAMTPRPSSVKAREAAAEPGSAPASEATPVAPRPAPVPVSAEPVPRDASPAPTPAVKPVVVVKPPSPPLPPAEVRSPVPAPKSASPAPRPPAAPAPVPTAKSASPSPRPAAPPTPVPAAKSDGTSQVLAPAATTRVPPLRRRATDDESPMGWGRHADRVVRARREASSAQRDTFLPLAFGLVGGALAGALVVTLFFLRHGSADSTPVVPVAHTASSVTPAAAIEDPVSHPQLEPAPATAEPSSTPGSATSSEAATTPVVAPPAVSPEPAKPRVTPAPPTGAATPARTARVRTQPGAAAARAIPTGEESWPLLCGEVVDETGAPVTGARILLADLDVGARTDRRGRFCLAAPPGDRTLSVVALGFATQRRAVSVVNGAADVHVVLKATP